MRCPECLREPGPTTYTCTVPGCLKMRFCCPACILEHMGKHAAALESELSVARSAIAGLMVQKSALEFEVARLTESATYTQNGKTASAMGWATICANLEAENKRLLLIMATQRQDGSCPCCIAGKSVGQTPEICPECNGTGSAVIAYETARADVSKMRQALKNIVSCGDSTEHDIAREALGLKEKPWSVR